MDPWKYYDDITHRDHILCNPLSSGTVDEILGRLDLAPGARVLEIACGKAEMLVRLVERYQISGIGVDLSPYSIRDTQARAAECPAAPRRQVANLVPAPANQLSNRLTAPTAVGD